MTKRANVTLWTIQALLALLFAFAGAMKLVLPIEAMQGPISLSGAFLRFIGVCEVLGAIGLVLPTLLRIQTWLTPLAASGLGVIMIGAVVVTVLGGSIGGAAVPAIVGVLASSVIYGRGPIWHTIRA